MILYIFLENQLLPPFERIITKGKKLKATAHVNQMKHFYLPLDKQYKDTSPILKNKMLKT